jgi:hypothetical protein
MAFASDIQLVRVTTDVMVDGIATKKLWVAAVPRQLAVEIVLDAIPEGWTAALLGPTNAKRLCARRPENCRVLSKPNPAPIKSRQQASGGLRPVAKVQHLFGNLEAAEFRA